MDNAPLFKALIAFQKDMQHVAKGEKAEVRTAKGTFSYTYADIAAVIEAIREPLAAQGLCQFQLLGHLDGQPAITTVLAHESGCSIEATVPMRGDNLNDPQKFGGYVTYFRRYALLAILGLATDDDDANAARSGTYPSHEGRAPTLPHKPRESPQTTTEHAPGASQWVTDWSDLWAKVLRPMDIKSAEQLTNLIGDYSSMSATEVHQKIAGDKRFPRVDITPSQTGYKMTEKQWSFIHSLARKKGLDRTGLDGVVGFTFDKTIEALDAREASTLVDELKALPDNPNQAAILDASGGVTAR